MKRRFIRQNREIVRVNSTQSLRIRNLEIEISRLLAENIALREQAIASAQEAEKWRTVHKFSKDVLDMKKGLELKLQEVNEMVQHLGIISENSSSISSAQQRSKSMEQQINPAEKDVRGRQNPFGLFTNDREGQDGRLPAILEDKYYPRRTLETTEIRSLLEDATGVIADSPELGPPPIAHFDVSEQPVSDQEVATAAPSLSSLSNSETRRKRRTSALLQDMAQNEDQSKLIPPKPNAKRKLDISELEEMTQTSTVRDDFVFQRRPNLVPADGLGKKSSRFSRPPGQTELAKDPVSRASTASTRKILAPKSANSPAKRRVHIDEKPIDKIDRMKDAKMSKNRIMIENTPADNSLEDSKSAKVDSQPKTPATFDNIMSPLSTEPSARDNRPQEVAILSSVEDVLNGSMSRGSRRARAMVSYVEPNLRDKMRRPGKELVGALEGIDRSRPGNDKTRDQDFSIPNESIVQSEKAEAKWKSLPIGGMKEEPPSPLREKEITRKKPQRITSSSLDEAVERLSIYDHPSSSPEPKENLKHANPLPARRKSVASRRHSVQPSGSDIIPTKKTMDSRSNSASGNDNEEKLAPSSNGLKKTNSISGLKLEDSSTKSERMVSRRRSMMV